MAKIATRGTSFAVKTEVTEGTPVLPTTGSDFIPARTGLSMTPNTESLVSEEFRSSLGPAKPILGVEAPTVSIPLYLKPSGVSGTAPNYGPELLKGAFGAEDDAGVEHDTVASSTVSVVKVDTGEGATYMRGQGLLIQDPTNGYSLRCVHSISSNDLSLNFNVANAPGTGVDLGEAITYYPASEHPSLTCTRYLGDAGAVDVVAGAKVTSMNLVFNAGQYIEANFELEGSKYYFNPIELTSSNNKLDFSDGSERNVVIEAKLWTDPHDLADAIANAMNDASADTITVTYSNTTGKFTIASNGSSLSLLWNTGAQTAQTIGTKIGFLVAADDTGSLTYTSDNAQSYAVPATPAFDNMNALVAKDLSVLLGDSTDNVCFSAESVEVNLDLPQATLLNMCSTSGVAGKIATERTVTADVVAYLNKYDADKFQRYRSAKDTRMQLGFGEKSGGNWVKGKCGIFYMPSATVTSYELAENNGLYALNFTLTAYVDTNNNGEVYLSFV